ncbi:GUN4 domain-containing protein [Leptolyngbya sp. GGD]|uniref:GUN4 domain-containing protein n=1 Tax=Leptolyngbya sp. GGD TaxID=2997907 RepID=UPI00227B4950|nr:GUN4 domain-containing protein [Leptolyngbya sp. GGD]MCY6488680.1 GUN4 domain-containing protein [Leptolyngbya sp. GGD]
MPEEPSKQASIPEQLAEILIKVLKPGGIGIGGGYGLWLLLIEDNVGKAIASTLIGFCFSYAGKLLEPIHKGNQQRLEKAGEVVNKKLDQFGEQAIAKLTSAEERYFEAQAAECETCSTEGMAKISGIFTPMLEEVFVPLEFDGRVASPGFSRSLEDLERLQASGVSIWDLLARAKRDAIYSEIAILAWGGYGKTTLLRHIAFSLGKNKQPKEVTRYIPVLLLLRKYREILSQETPPSLPELIMQHHIPSLPIADLKMPTDWAKAMLEQGKMLVMLDGFDEVPKAKRPLVARWLNAQRKKYRKSLFILTARPKAYNEQTSSDRIDFNSLLYVRNFNEPQRKAFVEKWYWCQEYYHHGKEDIPAVRKAAQDAADDLLKQINQRQELADLSQNPLLLNMIAMFHRRYPSSKLPKRRVELYQEICVLQLRDRPGARDIETWLTGDNDEYATAQVILQMLALEMMQQKEERVEQAVLLKRLEGYLKAQEESIAPADFLRQIEQISELLVQREPEEFEFPHLSFQEFLAAKEVVRRGEEHLLYERFGEDWWKSVILLYAAQVKKPSTLIRTALSQGFKDLADACCQETSKRIDTDLQQDLAELNALQEAVTEVKTSRYQTLEELLRTQQWKAADYETYRLMITTVGKEEGQWFDRADLENFPCEDLRILNQLWVKYSNSKWGFSVQKRIWQECGSPMEYNDAWEEFGDLIGWRKGGDWLRSEKLTYDLKKSLTGELPRLSRSGWMVDVLGWGASSRVGSLFSRRDL